MFKNNKALKNIDNEKRQLEAQRQLLSREKEELLFIKNQLEDISPKVDITNTYIFEEYGIKHIVNLSIREFFGKDGFGRQCKGYESTVIDIFTGNIIYQQSKTEPLKRENKIYDEINFFDSTWHYIYCYPICEVEKNLMAYTDKKVPVYVLQQLYYKLNNVNVNANILKKNK